MTRPRVEFSFEMRAADLPTTSAALRRDVRKAVTATGFAGALSVAVVADATMRRVNREFHDCDEPTDVLAFALGEEVATNPRASADCAPAPGRKAETRSRLVGVSKRFQRSGRDAGAQETIAGPTTSPGDRRRAGIRRDLPGDDGFHAEVIVSLDTARREAAAHGVEPAAELLLYVVHGVLHLMGYDDHSLADARRMHERALSILDRLGHRNTIRPRAKPRGKPRRHERQRT